MRTWQVLAFVALLVATAVAAYERATVLALIAGALALGLVPAVFQLQP